MSGSLERGARAQQILRAALGPDIITTRDSAGRITRMPIRLYGIVGDGLKLHANRRYRLVALYDNRTGGPVDGMAHMNGIFSPSDLRKWPATDSKAVAYLDDGTYGLAVSQAPASMPGSAPELDPVRHQPR